MNISRLFVLRPVATSLLMIALVLVGVVAVRFLPVSSLPDVDYPTIQVQTFYPGASPQVMATTVTAPLEVQLGRDSEPHADDVREFRRRLGHHLAVQSRAQSRHRRARCPAGHQRGQQPVAERAARAAGVCEGQSRRSAHPDAGGHLGIPVAHPASGHRQQSSRLEDFRSAGGGAGHPVRRQRAGGPRRGRPAEAGGLRAQYRRPAHPAGEHQRQPAQGEFRRTGTRLHHQRQRPDPGSRTII